MDKRTIPLGMANITFELRLRRLWKRHRGQAPYGLRRRDGPPKIFSLLPYSPESDSGRIDAFESFDKPWLERWAQNDNGIRESKWDRVFDELYPVKQGVNYSESLTPTSHYGVYPQSARSGSFPDHVRPSYHVANSTGVKGMAQQQKCPSMPQHDRHSHQTYPAKPDNDVPIDPSIAALGPACDSRGQYSPSAPNPGMKHSYSHPGGGMYEQTRQDWADHGQRAGATQTFGHQGFAQNPASAPPQAWPNQIYTFVPISGLEQPKRRRRRYENIERIYDCGWNGCGKAYGRLQHLNAHVATWSHGQKRKSKEFKDIRKAWEQRKKGEERQRQAAAAAAVQNGGAVPQRPGGTLMSSHPGRTVQLSPTGY
ncbi:related to putative transcriptional regulator [Fusarium fujikuroi]|nr:related to putative transcriptional regulator [Fusarium fujikuroi]